MMTQEEADLEQRLDITEAIYQAVINQENQELVKSLSGFKGDNVQWVLNKISEPITGLYDQLVKEYLEISPFKY